MKYHNEKLQAWCALDDDTRHAIRNSDSREFLNLGGDWVISSDPPLRGRVYRAQKLTEAEKFLEKWKGKKICIKGTNSGYIIPMDVRSHDNQTFIDTDMHSYYCNLEWQLWTPPEPKRIPLSAEDIKQGDAVRGNSWARHDFSYIAPRSNATMVGSNIVSYDTLMDYYKIRSIGETEWRPCHKE